MTITMDDFQKLDIRIGTVQEARDHPNADNLLLLQVDLGETENRQLVAGIKADYDPEEITGRQIVVITNMEPATIRGERSDGMLLAADADRGITLLRPDQAVKNGTRVR